jgi:hypothetical protein
MSTRGFIGRITNKPGKALKWKAVYNHWDSHVETLGKTLYNLRNGHFKGDTGAMLKVLVDECKHGWNTINGCDFNLPPAPRIDHNLEICKHCNKPFWSHYKQYYGGKNKYWIKARKPKCPKSVNGGYLLTYHIPEAIELPRHPECYAKGNGRVTEKNASKVGCEYGYLFTSDGNTMVVVSSYCENGDKMVGYFGCGNPNAEWKIIGEVNLNFPEPDWKKIPLFQKEVDRAKYEEAIKKQKEIDEKELVAKKVENKAKEEFKKTVVYGLMG